MRDLLGRGAFISGGASGIGLALARAFARQGMRVVIADQDADRLEAANRQLISEGAEVLAIRLDVADREAWVCAIGQMERFGDIGIVCANAGVAPAQLPLIDISPQQWDFLMGVNLTGVFNTIHYLMPLVLRGGNGGHVVITSSIAGVVAAQGIGDYTAAKYGVVGIGETLRAELKPQGIGVSIVLPGTVSTNLSGPDVGDSMRADSVANRVVEGVRKNDLYIFTHPEYKPIVVARCAAILDSFDGSAQPDCVERAQTLAAMARNAYPP